MNSRNLAPLLFLLPKSSSADQNQAASLTLRPIIASINVLVDISSNTSLNSTTATTISSTERDAIASLLQGLLIFLVLVIVLALSGALASMLGLCSNGCFDLDEKNPKSRSKFKVLNRAYTASAVFSSNVCRYGGLGIQHQRSRSFGSAPPNLSVIVEGFDSSDDEDYANPASSVWSKA
mmetsp:Transcript_14120/g.20879  ORF Transcript_14120/g.20879 Transcript_14120/m.20879 type:complete len:179 (+) Transcript_14120:58-594(+)